jgi:DNA repair exonuclease SbcCD ATPase subunit
VQELRNKLRMMKLPADEILNTVRRQQRAISKQKQANDTIRLEIEQCQVQIARIDQLQFAYSTDKTISELESQKKSLSNKLSVIQADFSVEDTKRRRIEEKVSRASSRAGGIFDQSREHEEVVNHLQTMENRLDKAIIRYNNNLTKLSALRSQMDEFRKGRSIFREVIRRAKSDRTCKQDEIAKLIEESNDAYSRRDTLNMRLTQVRSAEKEAVQEYEERLQLLTERIETSRITKGHHRNPQPPISPTSSQIGSSSDNQEDTTGQMEALQTAISQTLDLLQMRDVDELVAQIDRLEEENFSLYNFVVDAGGINAELQDELETLSGRKDELGEIAAMTDEQQSERLRNLTRQVRQTQEELDTSKASYDQEVGEFLQIYRRLERLFDAVGCSWDGAPDEKTTVTQVNVMFVLGQVELKITEVMEAVYDRTMTQQETRGTESRLTLSDDKGADSSARLITHTASQRDTIGKSVEATRPLTIEEIRELL